MYPGGWEQCLRDHQHLMGGRVWHDEHLFRDGAMSPVEMQEMVTRWQGLGFETLRAIGERNFQWVDVCVSESMFGGPTYACTWIAFDEVTGGAYLKGTEPGKLVGRRV